MKSEFAGYYRPTDAEFESLWARGRFAFDANVLLGLYRYSPKTSAKILEVVKDIGDRIFVPHQFAWEFQKNRVSTITQQARSYAEAKRGIDNAIAQLEQQNRHPFVGRKSLKDLKRVSQELNTRALKVTGFLKDDPYQEQVAEIFRGRVGKPCDDARLQILFSEARIRYEKRVPPGFADKNKSEPELFGDYVGWRQLVEFSASAKNDCILITADSKEDWWYVHEGKTIGPRPELVQEFFNASGCRFHMYTVDQFLVFASRHFRRSIPTEALKEIRSHRDDGMPTASEKAPKKPDVGVPSPPQVVVQEHNPGPPAMPVGESLLEAIVRLLTSPPVQALARAAGAPESKKPTALSMGEGAPSPMKALPEKLETTALKGESVDNASVLLKESK